MTMRRPLAIGVVLMVCAVLGIALEAWRGTGPGELQVLLPYDTPTVALAAGFVVLAVGFCFVVRTAAKHFRSWSTARILCVALLIALPLCVVAPLASSDAHFSFALGSIVRHGDNPYTNNDALLTQSVPAAYFADNGEYHLPTVYGPVWVSGMALLAHITRDDPAAGFAILRLFLVLGCMLAALMLTSSINDAGQRKKILALLVWNPILLIFGFNELHNDVILFLFLLLAIGAWRYHRFFLAMLFILVVGLVKYPILLLLPFFLTAYWLRIQSFARAAGAALVLAAIGFVAWLPYLGEASVPLQGVAEQARFLNATPFVLFITWIATSLSVVKEIQTLPLLLEHAQTWIRAASGAVLVILFGWATRQFLQERLDVLQLSFWLIFFLLLLTPFFLPGYLLLLLPFAATDMKLFLIFSALSSVLLFGVNFLLPILLLVAVISVFTQITRKVNPRLLV